MEEDDYNEARRGELEENGARYRKSANLNIPLKRTSPGSKLDPWDLRALTRFSIYISPAFDLQRIATGVNEEGEREIVIYGDEWEDFGGNKIISHASSSLSDFQIGILAEIIAEESSKK